MKKNLLITAALFLLANMAYSQCDPITTFPWTEGFENTTTIPPCWEQEIEIGWEWAIVPAAIGTPATALEGTQKAQIFLHSDAGVVRHTKLITPVFDLTALKDPVLKFWHTQTGTRGRLAVYYKNALDAEWILLKTWHDEISDWQEEIIMLPNTSSHYQIAFGGNFIGGGLTDLQLDAVSVTGEPVGITTHAAGQYLLVPNPVQDVVRISRPNAENIAVTIYNTMGTVIHAFETSKTDFNIHVADYAPGVYFIRLSDNLTSSTKRFVKQ